MHVAFPPFSAGSRSRAVAPLAGIRTTRARTTLNRGDTMPEARRMGKSELFSHFAERFDVKRTQARDFFDELAMLCEKELKRTGEFVLPGMVKLVVQKRKARTGRNPATGEPIKIAAKTVVKARIVKQLKDAVLPRK
jgi:DNA-binding protein HU-beta